MFVADPLLDTLLRGFILTAATMAWVILLVRVNGLRSFSKMTNFDFVMTVAVGSTLSWSGTSSRWSEFGQALVVLATLFLVQFSIAWIRKRSKPVERLLQNEPVLLMRGGEFIEPALRSSRVAKSDIYAKLREANVLEMKSVRAVVLETTGDISVLHGDKLEESLLTGVEEHGSAPAAS